MAITTASFRRWMEKAPENAFRRGPRRCSRNKGGGSFGRLGRDRSPRALFARTDIVSHACSDRGHNRRALARTRRRFAPRARVFNLLFPSSSREPREELLGARERGRLRILRARPRVSTRLPRVVKQTTTGASAAEPGWGGVRGASSLVVRRPRRVGFSEGAAKRPPPPEKRPPTTPPPVPNPPIPPPPNPTNPPPPPSGFQPPPPAGALAGFAAAPAPTPPKPPPMPPPPPNAPAFHPPPTAPPSAPMGAAAATAGRAGAKAAPPAPTLTPTEPLPTKPGGAAGAAAEQQPRAAAEQSPPPRVSLRRRGTRHALLLRGETKFRDDDISSCLVRRAEG